MDVGFISKRFILKTYLGWSDAQLAENERMWKEERSRLSKSFAPDTSPSVGSTSAGLSDVGITSSGIDSMTSDNDEGITEPTDQEDTTPLDSEVDNFGKQ